MGEYEKDDGFSRNSWRSRQQYSDDFGNSGRSRQQNGKKYRGPVGARWPWEEEENGDVDAADWWEGLIEKTADEAKQRMKKRESIWRERLTRASSEDHDLKTLESKGWQAKRKK